jgi:PAS domain S-box-containing protein
MVMLTVETLKAALTLTSVPMLAVGDDGRVVFLNAEFEELMGFTATELYKQPIECLLPRRARERHSEFVQAFLRVPAKRKMGRGRALTGVAKSGVEIPLELGLNAVDGDDGRYCIVVAVDLRVRQDHQRKMELAMEAAATAMVMVDNDGRIVLTNEAALELSGYSRRELLSEHVEILVPLPDRRAHQVFRSNYMVRTDMTDLKVMRRLHLRHKKGHLVPIEIALTPVSTPEGDMVMSTISDLTLRIAAEDEMTRKNQELEDVNRRLADANGELMQFAYGVSHDLKAPLASLLGLLSLMEEDAENGDPQSVADTVSRAKALCERSRTKVERVLKFAHDADEEDVVAVEFPRILEETWDAIVPGIEITANLTRKLDVEQFNAKPTGIQIVLQNLLDNAVKYHDPAKKKVSISVETRAEKAGVALIVSDDGAGIPASDKDQIFDMFRRADPRSGDGIGLALVKKQVNRLGGRISLESDVGQGTSVRVFLPQGKGDAPCRSPSSL